MKTQFIQYSGLEEHKEERGQIIAVAQKLLEIVADNDKKHLADVACILEFEAKKLTGIASALRDSHYKQVATDVKAAHVNLAFG